MLPTLLTGATGLLGQSLLVEALRADWPLAVLVRGDGARSAIERIESLLQAWELRLAMKLPRPTVIEGDLRQRDCALAPVDRDWLARHCRQVIHAAASVRFQPAPDGEPWKSNVEGTRHLLELCRAIGIRAWQHVSTVYVCGDRQGEFRETQLDVGQQPSNAYEHSKLEAERLVRAADWLDRANIFRPGIIVGDSRTGHSSTFHGFYAVLRAALALEQQDIEFDPVRSLADLGLKGTERKHLVPVDWVAATMAEIIAADSATSGRGSTYHLTPEHPITVSEMIAPIAAAVRERRLPSRRGRKAEPGRASWEPTGEALEAYRDYFRDDPQFDTSHTRAACPQRPCPLLDGATLRRLCDYALQANFAVARFEARRGPLDVPAWLLQSGFEPSAEVADADLRLELLGPGGGCWDLSFAEDQPGAFARAGWATKPAALRLDVETLGAIIAGRLKPAQALRSGRLLLTLEQGPAASHFRRVELLCRPNRRFARAAVGADA